jgi:tetratricopeptide (TPR) repeat protein
MNRATTSLDYKAAAEKYRRALWLTPWLASGYRRLAEAEEKAGDLEAAVGALNYYAAGVPDASARAEVLKKVTAIQGQIEALQKEAELKQQAEAQARLETSKKEAEQKHQAEVQANFEASKKGVCGELLILGKSVIRHTHVEHPRDLANALALPSQDPDLHRFLRHQHEPSCALYGPCV